MRQQRAAPVEWGTTDAERTYPLIPGRHRAHEVTGRRFVAALMGASAMEPDRNQRQHCGNLDSARHSASQHRCCAGTGIERATKQSHTTCVCPTPGRLIRQAGEERFGDGERLHGPAPSEGDVAPPPSPLDRRSARCRLPRTTDRSRPWCSGTAACHCRPSASRWPWCGDGLRRV